MDLHFLKTNNRQLRIGCQQDIERLVSGEVHLWLANMDHVPEVPLSVAEQLKLSTIKLPFVARRFASTRKLLRYLFDTYLKSPELPIETTDQGKPFLPEFPEFHFSITHSKKMIMVALSRDPVGVDLESMRKLDVVPIARRFFSPQELLFLQEESQDHNQQTFFKLWTAKEAALKADGGGIASGMKNNTATVEKGNVTSIFFKKKSWKISSWSFYEKSESFFEYPFNSSEGNGCFFGAIATLFVPAVIHWYDLRTFDKVSR